MRFTDKELEIIKSLFAENPDAVKLMRKVFLPEYDVNAPLGQVIDLYLTVKTDGKSAEEIARDVQVRNSLIGHLELCLQQLSVLAGTKVESVEDTKKRLAQNSNK